MAARARERPVVTHVLTVAELRRSHVVRGIVVLTRTQHVPRVCFVFEKLGDPLTLEVAA